MTKRDRCNEDDGKTATYVTRLNIYIGDEGRVEQWCVRYGNVKDQVESMGRGWRRKIIRFATHWRAGTTTNRSRPDIGVRYRTISTRPTYRHSCTPQNCSANRPNIWPGISPYCTRVRTFDAFAFTLPRPVRNLTNTHFLHMSLIAVTRHLSPCTFRLACTCM